MDKRNKYQDANEAKARVVRGGCRVEAGPFDTATVLVPKPGVGIGAWGAIDYLTEHGWLWRYDDGKGARHA